MELSWSTFVLEIINFLVLVWILKRFLYKPVLDVIARRRSGIEKTLDEAKKLREEAENLQKQYEGRLANWQQERETSRESLAREIEAERAARIRELQVSLEQEREKSRVAAERRQADAMHKMEATALMQGASFASRLLKMASGPEMEAGLVEMVASGLTQLSDERITALRNSLGQTPESIKVTSAFPLSDQQRQRLEQALAGVAGLKVPLKFEQNRVLLAGVRINIGAWVLAANLHDELKGFIDLAEREEQAGNDHWHT